MGVKPEVDFEPFDFARHEQIAVAEYLKIFSFYQELTTSAKRIADEALKRRSIHVHSIESRAKDPTNFGRKASKPSKQDPSKPMYPEPLQQITDLAAIRIITFFPRTIELIDMMVKEEFSVIEQFDKGEALLEEERFGYKSVHYLVTLNKVREGLPEYQQFKKSKVEIQVRTILQHAWAEIEHDIQYKSSASIPRDIRRRFMSLAGLLEIADREFQAIQDADRALTERAEDQINEGILDKVEITPVALKTYLDRRLGPDGRMSEFSYDWTVRLLRKLGFTSLQQVDECIRPYDHEQLSRIAYGNRQGQLSRFEYMLLAGMGERYIDRHLFAGEDWYDGSGSRRILKFFEKNGIQIGNYDPKPFIHSEGACEV
jgi:putative GTP pyrophosphokinase